jgi:hypothetical protein
MTIFDTAPLITCCKFEIDGQPIVDHILPHCHIIIPSAVRQELIAEKGRYPDAIIAAARVTKGTIEIRKVHLPSENVLTRFDSAPGERHKSGPGTSPTYDRSNEVKIYCWNGQAQPEHTGQR